MDLSFLSHDTLTAAQKLLGKYIYTEQDGVVTGGYITEVEAYLGEHDKAAHAYQLRRTKKNEMMYRDFGTIYVYTMHGHHCMNFITKDKAHPEGVLIRGIEPVTGIDTMIERRGREINLTDGPGKLTQSLGIKRERYNGTRLNEDGVCIREGKIPKAITASKRIGIDNKEEAVDYLYRFTVRGNPYVSKDKVKVEENNGWQ
ncbi:DNA-3-methyladenine glycosylase [Macrococcoides canis]|uniref:Putative 3-methyladenine DNA glycosylase n=1 Tax=Macrococcoides canis TaxID=1855823 RepID=A0A6G7EZK8_9STAP|nr:DNA-3-methyladenine glycosylase [Macrococcus canis]MCO4097581.1 DNA-3-methyladenine glycosylase [Macrococcus canis]QIH78993.1 DNA-3-methyladenine glycosylase [Macrococcus canis]QNR08525.1 DNA-3-methyladenine glycosylase [Macrococcus canis]QTQ07655.1 DNA-3-methyladenine glycosylase [Macrococcus canis]QUR95068.1 DNA-3-methyladenine glycosylase [Macrococcus canis]